KPVILKRNKKYREEHKEEMAVAKRQWNKENKEHVARVKKQYYLDNKKESDEWKNAYYRNKRLTDIGYALSRDVSRMVNYGLIAGGDSKQGLSILDFLEWTFDGLWDHL